MCLWLCCTYIIYVYLSTVCNQRMLLSTSMPGVFQPLSSSQYLPLCGICPSLTQNSLFAVKKHTLSCWTSALSRTLMSELLLMDSLAWRLAWGAPRPSTVLLECMQYLVKTIRFTHKRSLCQTCLSFMGNMSLIPFFFKRKCRAGLCVGCWYYPVFLVCNRQTQRGACSSRQLGLPCYFFCSTGTKLAPQALSHHQPQLLNVMQNSL